MLEPVVCLEGIAHDSTLDLSLQEWQRVMDLARGFGWKLANEQLWIHFYSPIREPEPMPAADARRMADALEGALVPRCDQDQFVWDPHAPRTLLRWCDAAEGKTKMKDVIAFLRKGGFFASYEKV
jgi:hypothetical protein